METSNNTQAMRALSKLYCIEADRLETIDPPEIAVLKAQIRAVQNSRAALDHKIREMADHRTTGSGISHEKAWKILTVTFALTGLAGFSAALFFSGTPDQPIPTPPPFPLRAPATVDLALPPTAEAPLPAKPAAVAAEKPNSPPTPKNGKHARPGGKSGRNQQGRTAKPPKQKDPKKDDLGFFDDCGMDPMCGFDKKSK